MRDLIWVCPQCSHTVCSALEGCEETLQDSQVRPFLPHIGTDTHFLIYNAEKELLQTEFQNSWDAA